MGLGGIWTYQYNDFFNFKIIYNPTNSELIVVEKSYIVENSKLLTEREKIVIAISYILNLT